ncbi:MAG TPA: alpha-isopropylmalate synthase regulatory domain-containing protein [Oscillospiraceae bacterium]|nr:alpha-isopropylmalate synthase regulatory domain-containing protein [Oscillospiraceae bacterium]
MGYDLTEEQLAEAFARFKELADKKKSVADGDIEAIVTRSVAGGDGDKYTLERFSVSCGTDASPKATVCISHCGVTEEAEGGGDGPIDALFFAVDRIVKGRYALEDYTVHAVSSGGEAIGTVTVKLSCDGETYTGTDISTDIVEASIKAYLNGINKLHEAKGAL